MFSDTPSSRRLPIGPAYAATQVNATVFRASSLASGGGFQYATYYDPDGRIVVAQRRVDGNTWTRETLPTRGNVQDAHNGVVLGISGDGILHLSYNHHSDPLHYRRTERPHDIRTFGREIPMTGQTEEHVTYPQFIPSPDGSLYFFYRDGASGNGTLCLNRYEPGKGWSVIRHPLIDGQGRCNPYWWRPSIGPDGSLHIAWCWRDSPDARSNHDICYIRSNDKGKTWQSVDHKSIPLPVVAANAPVAQPIPMGSNLINQCSTTVDSKNRPHLAQYLSDSSGIPQYTHLWHDGRRWISSIVSRRTAPFTLGGGGTLRIPISRPEIAVSRNGTVTLITRDTGTGGGIRLYRSHGRDYAAPWTAIDLTDPGEDLGEWEPTYDLTRLQKAGILSLFVLKVKQGDHETTTNQAAQTAFVMETPLS